MNNSEPDTLDELIADCAQIPASLRPRRPLIPQQRAANPWRVDDTCYAQVQDIDEYV